MRNAGSATTAMHSPRHLIATLSGAALAFLVLGAWAISSPVGSSPDDTRHLPAIWCAHGEQAGICEKISPGRALMPIRVATAPNCYAYRGENDASCQTDRFDPLSTQGLIEADYSYLTQTPGLFYWTMGLLKGDNLEHSVNRMRIFNALLAIVLVTALLTIGQAAMRTPVALAWVVAPIPLGLFIIPSTNPSSWAVIGVGTYWAFLLIHWEGRTNRVRIAGGVLAVLSAIIAAGGRTDAAAYIVVLTIAVFATSWLPRIRTIRDHLGLMAIPIACVIAALVSFRGASQSAVAFEGMQTPRAATAEGLTLLFRNAHELPHLWLGAFGGWPLGWLDTPMPFIVPFAGVAIVFALCFTGLRSLDRGKAVGLILVFASLSLLPLWILQQSSRAVGEELQPRYFLPLCFALLGIAVLGALPMRTPLALSSAQKAILLVLTSVAQVLALAFNVRRYTFGIDGSLLRIDQQRLWWSNEILTPMTTIGVAGIAFAGLAWLILFRLVPTSSRQEPDEAPSTSQETLASR